MKVFWCVLQEPSRPSSSGVALQQPLWPLWAGWGHPQWGHGAGTAPSLRQGAGLWAGQNLRGATTQKPCFVSPYLISLGNMFFICLAILANFLPLKNNWFESFHPLDGIFPLDGNSNVVVRRVVQGWCTGTVTLCKIPGRSWARNISEFHVPPTISIIYFLSLFRRKSLQCLSVDECSPSEFCRGRGA